MAKYSERKLPRLKGFNYSQNGSYFITICTKNRQHFFGEIVNGEMSFNKYGSVVATTIDIITVGTALASVHVIKSTQIDHFVIMPNHLHLIITINNNIGQGQALSLQNFVREIKSKVSLGILNLYKLEDKKMGKLWQRSYHDHIIRSHNNYKCIYEYMQLNPLQWAFDCHNSDNHKYID